MLMLATTVQARPTKFTVQSLLKLSKSPKRAEHGEGINNESKCFLREAF